MRSLQRLLLSGLLLLTACGFSPIYGSRGAAEGSPVAEALNAVSIENIAERNGQMLRNHLIDRLYFKGRPADPQARLTIRLKATEVDLGIQKDATATRSELTLTAAYELRDLGGRKLLGGSARSIVSYGNLEAQYGTLASQRSAYERAIREVGEQIVNRLSLYYAERTEETPTSTGKGFSALR